MKLFVRDLTVIDSSYLCERRGMVGESWLVDIEMSGELNEMSMLLDFGRVKKLIKSIIDEEVDQAAGADGMSPGPCPRAGQRREYRGSAASGSRHPPALPDPGFAFIPAPGG